MPRVYAAMEDALVVAQGDGEDWQSAATFEDRDPECVAAAPGDPRRLLVGTFSDGLFRSTDGGQSFEQVRRPPWSSSHPITAAAADPADPETVWVGTEPSAVYRSTDDGESFDEVGDVTECPSADEWSFPPRPETHHVRWIERDPNDPDRLYVGIEAGALVVSDDGGDTWAERPPGSRLDNHQLATHPDDPGRVYAAAGDGYAESTDGGETWEHPQAGLDHRYVWSVAVDPGDPDTVLVSAARGPHRAHNETGAESYVYRRTAARGSSRERGGWTPLDDRGLPTGRGVVRAVLAPGGEPGEVYAANNHGLFRTTTAGDRWERLPVDWERFSGQTCRGLVVV